MILPRAWALLRDCVAVLLEAAPPGVDVEVVRQHLVAADGVTDVHDLHAWSITSGMPALSAHVTVTDEALETRGVGRILDELGDCVATHFGIDHATFQVEPERHQEHEPGQAHQ
jgi:cobalt-zinc-cadmium efflux system protein